jgi:outer membrane protein assembly factor BamA
MRIRALVLAAVAAVASLAGRAPAVARAQTAPAETVVLLPPTPPRESGPSAPTIAPSQDLGDLAGRAITRVNVVLEDNVWDDVHIPAVSSLKPGDTLTPSAARRALAELLESGRFARAHASAQADGAGASVEIRAVPRKLVARVQYDARGVEVDREETLAEAEITEGGEIVSDGLGAMERRIERYFAVHGYPAAKAKMTTRDTDDPTRALLVVDVDPGAPRIIDSRRFYVIGSNRDRVEKAESAYTVAAGARADEAALDRADVALQEALRSRGWVRADVTHTLALVRGGGHPDRIELRIRVDAGLLFVVRFDGNVHYDDDVLTAVLELESENDRSPSHLADKIRAFYRKRAFLDADVKPELRGGDDSPVQLMVFHLSEGQRVTVTKRTYPCLKLDAIKNLHNGGPSSPGGIGTQIESFLDEDLPGADFFMNPNPRGLAATIGGGGGQVATGARPVPLDLHPSTTFVADTYDRAVEHVKELYRNEGFLHAQVGPVQVFRARCDPRSPPGRCVPLPMASHADVCTYDAAGIPAPIDPLDSAFTCRPDPAHDVTCAPSIQLSIPVKLGPRTQLWDLAFTGVKSVSEAAVAEAAQLPLGDAASTTKLEDARRRIIDWYRERGFYYVDVKYALEPSADNTRARARFEVTEGDMVIVRGIIVNGLVRTDEGVVRRRIALVPGEPFRTSDVRKTQERIATLGVFASVTVSLSDPYVPQANKDVIVEVVERIPQYIEMHGGFSTGEGVRGALEYGQRNLLGYAWAATLHIDASYLPDFLILDQGVAQNYEHLSTAERIATRDTLTFSWPEIGLGPTVRAQVDGVYVRDLERDFTLQKAAAVATLVWRPIRQVQVTLAADYENNDVHLFDAPNIATYLSQQGTTNTGLATLLRIPDGDSNVVAGRLVVTWDRRDNAFNAHRGTYVAAGIEEVNTYPAGSPPAIVTDPTQTQTFQYRAHFFRLTHTVAGYVPITSTITFAAELRMGLDVVPWCTARPNIGTLANWTCTYPDRLFFMGGFDSVRGWLQDSFIPQDDVDQISQHPNLCTNNQNNCNGVPLRGGNLMINPRVELRFPIYAPLEGAIFADVGNIWHDPSYIFHHQLQIRSDVGAGLRVDTPVGPLVFDYGINVIRHPYEDFGAFHFAIGLF